MTFFVDTNILLNYDLDELLSHSDGAIYLSTITIKELEDIKSALNKDNELKYKARQVLHWLKEHQDDYKVIIYKDSFNNILNDFDLPITPDNKIIATAYYFYKNSDLEFPKGSRYFMTDDLACETIARAYDIPTYTMRQEEKEYTGFKEVVMNDEQLNNFYTNYFMNNDNHFFLLENQYLIIKNIDGKVIDKYVWRAGHYDAVPYAKFESTMFGKIAPKDDYQLCIMDSINHNQLNVIRGQAGSGKSLIGLAYLFQELERHRIDKIIMFVNPVATKDSCKFGFLPGTFLEKVLGSQIGNFLASKLGDMEAVYQLIQHGKLEFIALADARGYDTSGMNCGLYITEAQNANIELMKLILSRVGEDTVCIIEGDNDMQTDLKSYEGIQNGLRRVCEVFAGEDYFGTITLQNCYRSRIAEKAVTL